MNFYKITPLTKQVYQRGVRYQSRHPDVDYTHVNRFAKHNIDVVELQKWRQNREEDYKNGRIYQGGDQQDRKDYILEQKARLGKGHERMMAFSNKRAPKGKFLNYDMPFIEFNMFPKEQLAPYEVFRPADMGWSAREFINIIDSGQQSDLEDEAFKKIWPDIEEAMNEMDEFSKYYMGVDPSDDEADKEVYIKMAAESRREFNEKADEMPLRSLAGSEKVSQYLLESWNRKDTTAPQIYAQLEEMYQKSVAGVHEQIDTIEKQEEVTGETRILYRGLLQAREAMKETNPNAKEEMMAIIEKYLADKPKLRGNLGKRKIKGSRKNKK